MGKRRGLGADYKVRAIGNSVGMVFPIQIVRMLRVTKGWHIDVEYASRLPGGDARLVLKFTPP